MRQFLFIIIISILTISCDSIYIQKSKPLEIKTNNSFSEALRVQGEMQLFPTLKNVYFDSKEKVIRNEVLVILFYKKEEVTEFKESILRKELKTFNEIKSVLDSKKGYYFIIPELKKTPFAQPLQNVSVFKNGLWFVFYSEKPNQEIGITLEFKRLGSKEIPKTEIVKVL